LKYDDSITKAIKFTRELWVGAQAVALSKIAFLLCVRGVFCGFLSQWWKETAENAEDESSSR
jgi:hypothetical protein